VEIDFPGEKLSELPNGGQVDQQLSLKNDEDEDPETSGKAEASAEPVPKETDLPQTQRDRRIATSHRKCSLLPACSGSGIICSSRPNRQRAGQTVSAGTGR